MLKTVVNPVCKNFQKVGTQPKLFTFDFQFSTAEESICVQNIFLKYILIS